MSSLSRVLLVVAVLLPSWAIGADESPRVPELYVPDKDDSALPQGVIRRFGSTAFRHKNVYPARFSPAEPFFSPEGDLVYVPGNGGLLAFDAVTGRVRFHYHYGGYNLTVRNDGAAGICINFTQGPLSGQFALLEHSTGKELQRGEQPLIGKDRAYSTFANGRRALGCLRERRSPLRGRGDNQTAVLYDVPRSEVLARLGKGGTLHTSVLSEDQRLLAFRTEDMELRVFETESGRLLQSLPLGLREGYDEECNPAWSHDAKTVYIWRRHDDEMQVVALDVESGTVRVLARDGRKRVFSSPIVSPDGSYLAYQMNDDPWSYNWYWRILRLDDLSEAHIVDVRPARTRAAFSPDGRSFWLLGHGALARFDLVTGKLDPLSADPLCPTQALSFSSDASLLYAVAGSELITWDVASGREIAPRREFDDDYKSRSHLQCLHVSDDGHRTIWLEQSSVRGLLDGRPVSTFYAANTTWQETFFISVDHRHIVHDAYYGELKLGDLWSGESIRELLPKVRPRESFRIALAPDTCTMALFHRNYENRSDEDEIEIEIWNVQNGFKTGSVRQVGGNYMVMQFSQDSRELRVWHRGKLSVWNVAKRELLREQQRVPQPDHFHCTPNRHWHFTTGFGEDGSPTLDLRDIHSGQVARRWDRPPGRPRNFAFSLDMSLMAVSSAGTPADLYQFYEPRDEAAALARLSETQLVETLGGNGVAAAFDAMCELIRRGDDSIPALRAALTHKPISPDEVATLIEQLDNDDFDTREVATRKLSEAPLSIAPYLERALKQGGSLETVARMRQIQAGQHSSDVSRSARTAHRGVETLAAIGTTASRELLVQLSEGAGETTAIFEARATLSAPRFH